VAIHPLKTMVSPPSADDASSFEEWRGLLFGIAYRMLGSATDAEDMVQEAYLRWVRRSDHQVESVRAYLVTIVTRLCIDHLASARVQRVSYTGPWLPEPIMADQPSRAEQADSLTMAFLVLLEELTPTERAAFLLHDIFGYRFDEVARSLGRTAASCRQLASRARRHIDHRRQRFDADLRHGRELTREFMVACGSGDLDGLLGLLADDVVVWTDGGGKVRAAMRPVVGAQRSSRFLLNVAKKVHGVPREVTLNGQPALVFFDDAGVAAALVLDISGGKIVGVRTVSNPDKLARLSREFAGDRRHGGEPPRPENEAGPPSREERGYEPEPAPSDLR
jgi:RNA polymerase sigma-70 factor (ECF subfamily)